MTLVAYLALPMVCVLAIPGTRTDEHGALAEALVFGVALYEALLLANGLVLGLTARLTPHNYALLTGVSLVVLGALAARRILRAAPASRDWRWLKTRRGAASGATGVALALSLALQLGADALWGTRHWDGLGYHVGRALFWIQQGTFEPWPTATWQEIGLPVAADAILASKVLLGLGWAGTSYVSAVLTVGAVACVYLAALDLGLPRWHCFVGALLFASFPAIGLRVWHLNSDVAAAFPVMAGYVALIRIARRDLAIALFMALCGIGVACKPTVAPFVVLLAFGAYWRRRPLSHVRELRLPLLGVAAGCAAIAASYWPVYQAFGDVIGGEFGRACAAGGAREFARGVAANLVHWLVEPLGYVPIPYRGDDAPGAITRSYEWLGVFAERALLGAQYAEEWQPAVQPDTARTGLIALAAFPIALATLPRHGRAPASLLWVAGFIAISGMVYAQPWGGRFAVVVYGGYALAWASSRLFRRRQGKWVLLAMTALNVAALLAAAIWTTRADSTKSRPGGVFDFIRDADRREIARRGYPLWVLGESSNALLVGTRAELGVQNLLCPSDGAWVNHLRAAAQKSPVLALSHRGGSRITPGPNWTRPGQHRCAEVELSDLREFLRAAGWTVWASTRNVEFWENRHSQAPDLATREW